MANQQSRALAAPSKEERLARIPGAYRNPKEITARLQYAAENFHLVSPATACGAVPEGCSISLSTVIIDVDRETYDVAGGRGLSKVALDKISAAAGISWDAKQSGRIDDGSDPHYCMWRSVGRMRHLDGTEVQIIGHKEMDLREGSPTVGSDTPKQVKEKRLHITSHAETKARLRAVRSIGIRTAYTKAELEKPFVVAKIMWTGQSTDPELRRLFAMKQADAMIGGSRALYGESAPTAALPAMTAPLAPPPVGRSLERDDDYDAAPRFDSRTVDMPPPTPAPAPAAQAAAPVAPAAPSPAPTAGGLGPSGVVMKFGKGKGTPIEQASDRDLEWYGDAIAKSVDDPEKSRYREGNERELAAVRAEVARRAGGAAPASPAAAGPVGGGDWGDYGGNQGGDDEIPF
jgi:hypothetical protein